MAGSLTLIKRREAAAMLWWTSCSGERVLEDDTIQWRHQQTWMGETSTRWSCGMFMHRAREIGRLSRFVKKHRDYHDRNVFNHKCQKIIVLVGCVIFLLRINSKMKIVLALAKKQDWEGEYQKDKNEHWTFRRRNGRCLHHSVGALHQEDAGFADAFAMRWWEQGHDDAYWHHIATSNTFTEVVPMGFQQKNLKRLLRALFQDRLLYFV